MVAGRETVVAAMKGRKPTAPELRLIQGGSHKGARENPKPAAARVSPPEHLSGLALATFRRVAGNMATMGTLGAENREALAIYSTNWARMVEAEKHVAEHGAIVPAPRTGTPMHNPYLAVANRAAATVAKLAAELGLTPTARARLSVEKPKAPKNDPAARFLSR